MRIAPVTPARLATTRQASDGVAASAVLGVGQAVLRNEDGDPLATVALSAGANMSADAVVAHAARKASAAKRVVTVRRAAKVRGALRAWVCAGSNAV